MAETMSGRYQEWSEKRRDEVVKAADEISKAIVTSNIIEAQKITVSLDVAQQLAHMLRTFVRLMESEALCTGDMPEGVQDDFDAAEHMVVMLARKIIYEQGEPA